MTMGFTSGGDDVECTFDIPVIIAGDEPRPPAGKPGGPWRHPEHPSAREALERGDALLDVLHRALRAGDLSASGAWSLGAVQRFYQALRLQVDEAA
jgi:hypothetical protein